MLRGQRHVLITVITVTCNDHCVTVMSSVVMTSLRHSVTVTVPLLPEKPKHQTVLERNRQ